MRAGTLVLLAGCVAPVPVEEPVDTGPPALGYWGTTCRQLSQFDDYEADGSVERETYWTWQSVPGVGMLMQESELDSAGWSDPIGRLYDQQGHYLFGGVTGHRYDEAGDLVYQRTYVAPGDWGNTLLIREFDAHHNLVRLDSRTHHEEPSWVPLPAPDHSSFYRNTYDTEDRLVLLEGSETGGNPWTVFGGWEYDDNGLLVLYYEDEWPPNPWSYGPSYEAYGYDDQLHLSWAELQDAQRRCIALSTYDTDAAGNILEERLHDGCDPTDRVTYLQQYTWDAAGRMLTHYTEDRAGLGFGPSHQYTWTYDERGNLTSEWSDRLSAPAPLDDRYTTWTWECP